MDKKYQPFEERAVYQIYPLSFSDSNNDGIGDINGIIQKLDYLKDLGIGIIWLSPIYKSPLKDNGYDISDYYDINPLFGTMEDFDNLIKEAKKRDIYIVMDLVINHTSNEHPWFKEALSDPSSKYRKYYYFEKGKGKKRPPNNWTSTFSGGAWEKIENEDNMYYLHLFSKEQIDLNYHSEELIEEIEKILKFWLDKGVYGFRCDVINRIYKSSLKNGRFRLYEIGREHYINQAENYKILERLQNNVLKKYGAFLVGETFAINYEDGKKFKETGALDMFFEFDHAFSDQNKIVPVFKKKFKPKNLINPVLSWIEEIGWMANYLENHDQRRSVSRYGDEEHFYNLSAKALATFLLSLRGTPFIYQGEEIGMNDDKDMKYEDVNDVSAIGVTNYLVKLLHLSKEKAFKLVNETTNRDHARTPMQWNKDINAGFNNGTKPWLKINESYKKGINVEDEYKVEDSILNYYKKMIHFRNNDDVLKHGLFKRIKSNKNVAKFIREYEGNKYLVVINLSNKKINDIREDKEILISNYENHSLNILNEYEAIIYKL